jgi:hypothetical protein
MAELTEQKDKGGRPRKEFDEKDFKILETAIIWGSEQYCADKLDVSIPTLKTRIEEHYNIGFLQLKEQKRAEVKNNLRLKQYEIAMKGNVSMLIWLGKNELGQSDKMDTTNTNIDLTAAKKEIAEIFGHNLSQISERSN